MAYGAAALPSSTGHAELTLRTWRPLQRQVLEEARQVQGVSGADLELPGKRKEVLNGQEEISYINKYKYIDILLYDNIIYVLLFY